MPVYNMVSCKRVISKIFSDLDLQEDTHKISDFVEWIGSAVEAIGAFPALEDVIAGKNGEPLVEISNYQARVPFGLHSCQQIAYSPSLEGPFFPMRTSTGSFERTGGEVTSSPSTEIEDVASTSSLVILAMSMYDLNYQQALAKINDEPAIRSLLTGLLTSSNITQPGSALSNTTDYVYTINGGWIKTNIVDGYLMIAYKKIPVDAEGFPLVPDNFSYLEALYWFVQMKLLYQKWAQGQVRDAVYYDAKKSWAYYAKQAYGNAMLPSADEMESIKNSWLRLIPDINQHNEFYSTLGEQEVIFNQNRV